MIIPVWLFQPTTWYYYTRKWGSTYADIGSVTWIVTQQGTTNNYTATRFGYGMNDRTLTFAVGESWTWDGNAANCPQSYNITWAREFRYDGARARYLNRQLDTTQLMQGNIVAATGGDTWTDYDGDEAYGDYTVSGATVTNLRSYEPGIALADWGLNPPSAPTASSTDYFVTDHLGTTRGVTLPSNAGSVPADAAAYTAFGERTSGTNYRFGYVGEFGYQAHSEMPYLHVGARYYDPAIGRFLQRDPIGMQGGTNVYEYSDSVPTDSIDPEGLFSLDDVKNFSKEVAKKIPKIVKKILEDRLGGKPPKGPMPIVETAVKVLDGVPDLVRIKKATDHRRRLLDSGCNINDAMDEYEKGHNKNVKPGKGG